MVAAIVVSDRVVVPVDAIELSASRSSGPGGQNVNKVASKVQLRIDVDRIIGLAEPARRRLLTMAASRLDAEGRICVMSQRTRDQQRNIDDAREKVRALVARALVAPRVRRETKPTRGSVRRRLEDKRQRSERKRARRTLDD